MGLQPLWIFRAPPLRASDASPQRLAYSKKWRKYSCMGEVESDIFDYIEAFYNRRRLHSTLGYLSQVEYRLKRLAA
ncbi:IS3 family transposase [Fibrobacter sp. UWH5]|uniref:IS3 family transposase n=1 Tax=Fibrobacter sp. UWH5 TaxID=1896211 RepID=UPI00210F6E3A|nr:IS3 family transposase [Fibrobacter sp. UWH5]